MKVTLHVLREGLRGKRLEGAVMLAVGCVYFFSFFQRVAVPGTVFDELQADLSLSAKEVTALGAAYLYIYACMQMVVGYTADRFGGLRLLLGASALLALGAIAFPLSVNRPMIYASRAVIGFGGSFVFICMLKELDQLFGAKYFAVLYGPFMIFGSLGALCGTWPLERLVDAIGWRPSFLIVGVATAVVVGWLAWLARRIGRQPTREAHSIGQAVRRIIVNRRVWLIIPPSSALFMIYFCLQATMGKKMLQDVAGLSSAQAAGVAFAMLLVSLVLTLTCGMVLVWTGHRRKPVMIFCGAAALLGAGCLAWSSRHGGPTWMIIAGMILSAVSVGLGPAFLCSLKELCPTDSMGMAVGVCNTVSYLAVAMGTNLVGIVLDLFKAQAVAMGDGRIVYPGQAYARLFELFTVLAAAAFACTLAAPETRGVHQDESTAVIGRSVA